MNKNTNPGQMTLRQFLLFLIVGGIALIWLCLEIMPRFYYGDPLYPVENYIHLKSELISNSEIFIPDESVLPSGDHTTFCAYESTRKKLNPMRDGYSIGVLGKNYAFQVECSPASSPLHLDGVPDEIHPDYLFYGIPVMCADGDFPQMEFVVQGYYYQLTAWGTALPKDASDTLLRITENILEQAG